MRRRYHARECESPRGPPAKPSLSTETLLFAFAKGAERFDWSVHFDQTDCENLSWSVKEVREVASPPLQIVAVADYSGSMSDHVDTLNWSLYGLSKQLRSNDELALVAFDERSVPVRGLAPGALDGAVLDDLFGKLGGGTFMYRAVEFGLTRIPPESSSKQILVLFSDGEDNDGARRRDDAHAIADGARQRGIQIFSIGIGSADKHALRDSRRSRT